MHRWQPKFLHLERNNGRGTEPKICFVYELPNQTLDSNIEWNFRSIQRPNLQSHNGRMNDVVIIVAPTMNGDGQWLEQREGLVLYKGKCKMGGKLTGDQSVCG